MNEFIDKGNSLINPSETSPQAPQTERVRLSKFVKKMFSKIDRRVGGVIGVTGSVLDQIVNARNDYGDIDPSQIAVQLRIYTDQKGFLFSDKGITYGIDRHNCIKFMTQTPDGSFSIEAIRGGAIKGFERVRAERIRSDEDGQLIGAHSVRTFAAPANGREEIPLVLGQKSKRQEMVEMAYGWPEGREGDDVILLDGQKVYIVNYDGPNPEFRGTYSANPTGILWEMKNDRIDARYPSPTTDVDIVNNTIRTNLGGYNKGVVEFPIVANIYGQLAEIVKDIIPEEGTSRQEVSPRKAIEH